MVRLAVMGLGRMGLPLACAYAEAGLRVIGFDVDRARVEMINRGRPPVEEPGLAPKLRKALRRGRFEATADGGRAVAGSDIVLVIVPVGLNRAKRPNLGPLLRATSLIARHLRRGQLVIYETTVPIGTTEYILKPALERGGLKAGRDFGLVYSPENLMSGLVFQRIKDHPKIIGSLTRKDAARAAGLYRRLYPKGVHIVSSPRTAELIKLTAGVRRFVDIAYANEIAMICDRNGVDFREVKAGVDLSTLPAGFLSPGAGVGGHCIPVYPYLLSPRKRRRSVIESAKAVNEAMPSYVLKLLEERLKLLKGKRVLVLGLSYRPKIKDLTFSPGVRLSWLLKKAGCQVRAYDPHLSPAETRASGIMPLGGLNGALKLCDAAVLTTECGEFRSIAEQLPPHCAFIDGRNFLGIGKGVGVPLIPWRS